MCRKTFYENKDYIVEYEIGSHGGLDQFHLHCNVTNFSNSVLKDMYITFARLLRFAGEKGFDKMYSVSPNPKFCELFGAESIGSFGDFEVMVWQ